MGPIAWQVSRTVKRMARWMSSVSENVPFPVLLHGPPRLPSSVASEPGPREILRSAPSGRARDGLWPKRSGRRAAMTALSVSSTAGRGRSTPVSYARRPNACYSSLASCV
jgi:hypothetical protein